jgi:STAS-like domain of unknown function (DUF4325)
MEANPIIARTVISKSIAAMDSDGQKVFMEMTQMYERYGRVTVSFAGINLLTTAFLNASFGQFILAAHSSVEGEIRAANTTFIDLANPKMHSQIDSVRDLALDSDFSAAHDAAMLDEYA